MEKNRKIPSLNKPEETSTVRIVSTPKSVVLRTMENSSSNDVLRNYTSSWMPEEYLSYTPSPFSFDNGTNKLYLYNTTVNGPEKITCQWEAAQHNLFQFSNMCFLSAFVIPRNYKSSILLFRIFLTVSFVISAIWAGVHFCALDWFLWSSGLALTNSVHAVVLTFKFLPPALSLELTELYIRMFKPLKVSKKHFKELTKEACLLRLAPGETYAIEEVSPADEKLSVLLKGRLKVSCNGTFLHNISSYQFIDSPEWQANVTSDGTRFQVTISAEEDSLCITWARIKIDRILRHRPQLGFILNNLVGKDITHKMYSLNEQIGQMCTTEALSRAAKEDHWRRSMNRSVSVDAVDTGTRGQVRSTAWKQSEKFRKSSTHSENASPLLGPQQCWLPLVASQFPAEYPFMMQDDSVTSQDDEREPMLPKNPPQKSEPTQLIQISGQPMPQPIQILSQFPKLEAGMSPVSLINVATSSSFLTGNQSVALIPVIVPVLATTVNTTATNSVTTVPTTTASRAASLRRQRGVKFDETQL